MRLLSLTQTAGQLAGMEWHATSVTPTEPEVGRGGRSGTSTRDEALVLAMLNGLDALPSLLSGIGRQEIAPWSRYLGLRPTWDKRARGMMTGTQLFQKGLSVCWTSLVLQLSRDGGWPVCIITWWSRPWVGYGRPEQRSSRPPPPMSCYRTYDRKKRRSRTRGSSDPGR